MYSNRPFLIIRRTFDIDAGTAATKSFRGRNRRGDLDWRSIVYLKASSIDSAMKYESPEMVEGKGARTFSLCVFDRPEWQIRLLSFTQRNVETFAKFRNLFANRFKVFAKEICKRSIKIRLHSGHFIGVSVIYDPPVVLQAKLPRQ